MTRTAPPGARPVSELLEQARRRLARLEPAQAWAAMRDGALLVDIRPQAQRDIEGDVPGALVIERNVLEWRCDPTSEAALPQAVDDDVEWVVLCSEGYTSSLVAASLRDLGLHNATDVVGGYRSLADTGVLAQLTPGHARRDAAGRSFPESTPRLPQHRRPAVHHVLDVAVSVAVGHVDRDGPVGRPRTQA